MVTVIRRITFTHALTNLLRVSTHHDTCTAREVFQRSTFLEEFRVGADIKVVHRTALVQHLGDARGDTVCCPHWYGRLVDDDLVAIHELTDGARHGQYILEVGTTVFIRRRADSDELQSAMLDSLAGIGSEAKAPRFDIAQHHTLETRLIDGYLATLETVDLGLVHIHAHYIMANIRQAGTSDQAYIACSEDSDVHVSP